jgi:hypothetical protein
MGEFIDEYIKDALENKDLEDIKDNESFRFTVTISQTEASKLDVLSKYLRMKRATLAAHAISVVIQEFEYKLQLTPEYVMKYHKGELGNLTEIQEDYFTNVYELIHHEIAEEE